MMSSNAAMTPTFVTTACSTAGFVFAEPWYLPPQIQAHLLPTAAWQTASHLLLPSRNITLMRQVYHTRQAESKSAFGNRTAGYLGDLDARPGGWYSRTMIITPAQRRVLRDSAKDPDGHVWGCPDPRIVKRLLVLGLISHIEFGGLALTEAGRKLAEQ